MHNTEPISVFLDQLKACNERWSDCRDILKKNGVRAVDLEVEKFADNEEYLKRKMVEMGLDKSNYKEMLNVVDYERLTENESITKSIKKSVLNKVKNIYNRIG